MTYVLKQNREVLIESETGKDIHPQGRSPAQAMRTLCLLVRKCSWPLALIPIWSWGGWKTVWTILSFPTIYMKSRLSQVTRYSLVSECYNIYFCYIPILSKPVPMDLWGNLIFDGKGIQALFTDEYPWWHTSRKWTAIVYILTKWCLLRTMVKYLSNF